MIKASLYNLFLFNVSIVDRYRRSKFVILSYFLSSEFAYVIITTTGELDKQAKKDCTLEITKVNRWIQERVNGNNSMKVLITNRNVLVAPADGEIPPVNGDGSAVLANKDTLVSIDRNASVIPVDKNQPVSVNKDALILANRVT